jgi:uncharacterized protein
VNVVYLDSSAIVKTIIEEPESPAVRGFLRDYPNRVSAELARAEVIRAVRRAEPRAVSRAYEVLDRLSLIGVSADLLEAAGLLDPPALRTLDAIHLAAARTLAGQLGAFVTYDARMQDAASELGLPVEAPR